MRKLLKFALLLSIFIFQSYCEAEKPKFHIRDEAMKKLTIMSGGQTGVDRAALDVAMQLGIPVAGFCPKGRIAEDGLLDLKYPLQESVTSDYLERTFTNVLMSDGTLILCNGELTSGTLMTKEFAVVLRKPYHVVDLQMPHSHETVVHWIKEHSIRNLNFAGPRESKQPGVYTQACNYLLQLFLWQGQ